MHDFDPCSQFNQANTLANTPGLGEAFAIADSALEAGLGLDHWKNEFERQNPVTAVSNDEETWLDSDRDAESDLEVQRVMHESRKCLDESSSQGLGHGRPGAAHHDSSHQEHSIAMTRSPEWARRDFPTIEAALPIPISFHQTSGGRLGLDRLGQRFRNPTSDIVDGEL